MEVRGEGEATALAKRNYDEIDKDNEGNDVENSKNVDENEIMKNIICTPCHQPKKVMKRQNVIPWDDYFMAVSFLSSMRSKDPSTQVGACIVNEEKRIVGIGYNGFPKGCSDDDLPWNREGENELDTKYPYVCHAEVNAILNKNSADVKGCTVCQLSIVIFIHIYTNKLYF
jgi:hypothetical protein